MRRHPARSVRARRPRRRPTSTTCRARWCARARPWTSSARRSAFRRAAMRASRGSRRSPSATGRGSPISTCSSATRPSWTQREGDKWLFRPPGGETYEEVARRVGEWYATLDRDTVVTAHGGTARALVGHLGIAPPEEAAHQPIEQGCGLRFRGQAADAVCVTCQPFDRGPPRGYHHGAAGGNPWIPCRSTRSAICSGSRPLARATGRRSAAWSTAARPASR